VDEKFGRLSRFKLWPRGTTKKSLVGSHVSQQVLEVATWFIIILTSYLHIDLFHNSLRKL
jgi:hypothetical protein